MAAHHRALLESLELRRLLSATISGTIYQDIGGVGSLEPGDPPLAGWTVFLDLNHNGVLDAGEPSAVTDASGRYTFANVAAGSYQVREEPVTGFKPIPLAYQNVTVVDGQTLANVDIGNQKLIDFIYPGLTSAQDAVNNNLSTGSSNAPNSSIAVSPKNIVAVNNNSITIYRRTDGTELTTEPLATFFADVPNPSTINAGTVNAGNVTDAEVFYSPGAAKFFIAALANTSTASYILIASSRKTDPTNGTWHFHSLNAQLITHNEATVSNVLASNLSLSFNGSAVYITANVNDATTGALVGSRLWMLSKSKAFAKSVTNIFPANEPTQQQYNYVYDPSAEVNLSYDLSNFDAANYSGKSIGDVGVAYFVANTPTSAGLFDIIKVTRPGNNALFSSETITTPSDISISSNTPPPAAQPDGAPSIDTSVDAISGTWRGNFFWVADTLVPSNGVDAGTAQVYWFQFNLPNYALQNDGSVSGSGISSGASTFSPSIVLDRDQYMALSFAASGPSLDPSEYAVSRRGPDPSNTVRAPLSLAAGTTPYTATAESSGLVDWGLNQMVLDPITQERFWSFSHYATDPTSTAGPWSQQIVGFEIPPKVFPVING